MEQPAPAYEGDEPYVFVSYSHRDEDLVYGEIRWLQDHGVKVWYDTQIQAGSEWSDALATAISGCSRFLYFITPNSVATENCRRELNHAIEERRAVLAVHLLQTEVPGGIRLNLNNRQAILKFRLAEDEYRSALVEALTSNRPRNSFPPIPNKPRPSRRPWIVLGAFATLLLIALGWFALRDEVTSSDQMARKPPSMPTEGRTADDAEGISAPDPLIELGGTTSTQARAHYLVAEPLVNGPDAERALKELENAIEIDSEFADAWIAMTYTYGAISRDPEKFEAALDGMGMAAARAVASAPEYWRAHVALWVYLTTRRDFVGADRAFHKAMALAEAAGIKPTIYAQYLWQFGRNKERIDYVKSIAHIDPEAPARLAQSYYYLGRRDEALAEMERLAGDDGTRLAIERDLAIERGNVEELDAVMFNGTDLEGLWGTDAFLDALREALASDTQLTRGYFAYSAITAARHGDIELALAFLRREYLRHAYGNGGMIWHPLLADVRAHEGFKTFLRDYGIIAMFKASGDWNDYCQPVGVDDFECR